MRTPILIVALATLSACSGQASDETVAQATEKAVGDYHSTAQCSAKMEAVSNLYAAIADTTSADSAGELRETAELRAAAARLLKAKAEEYAGDASAQVETIIAETRAYIEAERGTQAFEDFAVWVGKEADGCAPMVKELVENQ